MQAHLPIPNSSTGGQAFQFTPDSSKLVMTTTFSSYVLIIDLAGEKPRVLRRFDQHRFKNSIVHNRVVKGRKSDDDVDMVDVTDNEEDHGGDAEKIDAPAVVSILRISISPDGQWLATSDDHARTHIFNLDSIQVIICFAVLVFTHC